MSTDFDQLSADIELEARQEGPGAVRELAQFREEFGSASRTILRWRGGGRSFVGGGQLSQSTGVGAG